MWCTYEKNSTQTLRGSVVSVLLYYQPFCPQSTCFTCSHSCFVLLLSFWMSLTCTDRVLTNAAATGLLHNAYTHVTHIHTQRADRSQSGTQRGYCTYTHNTSSYKRMNTCLCIVLYCDCSCWGCWLHTTCWSCKWQLIRCLRRHQRQTSLSPPDAADADVDRCYTMAT